MAEPGTVTQESPLLVRLDASDSATPALRLDPYIPTEFDRVAVIRQGSQLLVLGKVV